MSIDILAIDQGSHKRLIIWNVWWTKELWNLINNIINGDLWWFTSQNDIIFLNFYVISKRLISYTYFLFPCIVNILPCHCCFYFNICFYLFLTDDKFVLSHFRGQKICGLSTLNLSFLGLTKSTILLGKRYKR